MALINFFSPHSAGYLRQKIILARRRAKKLQNQILFVSELNRRLNPIEKDKMNRVKTTITFVKTALGKLLWQ
jgi:hypothetical protein